MLQQQVQRKQKNFALQRGLYVVRYEAAADPAKPPLVSVQCEAGRNEVILHPEQSRPTMSAPGQALVIRAIETGNVQVEISSPALSTALDATLKFEPLRCELGSPVTALPSPPMPAAFQQFPPPAQRAGFAAPSPATQAMQAAPAAGLQLLAHVARLGDVMVGANEWVGGPSAPARVEGFLLRWPGRPADVQIRYAASVAGQRPGEVRIVETEEFTGTRGRARPLLGVMMELVGAGARNYSLGVEAVFLGAPVRRATGSVVNLSGPTGREPLVGLRVAIAAQGQSPTLQQAAMSGSAAQGGLPAMQASPSGAAQAPASDKPKVRVFRA